MKRIIIIFLICKLTYSMGQHQELVTQKKTDKFILLYIPNAQKEVYVFDLATKAKTKLEDLSPILLQLNSRSATMSIVAFDNNTFLAEKRSTHETGIADFSGSFKPFGGNAFLKAESLEMKTENDEACNYFTVVLKQADGKRKLGFIHKRSGTYVAPAFDDIDLRHTVDNKLIVSNNTKFGIISDRGDQLIPVEYDNVVVTKSNTFILVKSNTVTFMNADLKIIERLTNFTEFNGAEDFFVFNQDNLYGVVNEQGQLILQPEYLKIDQQQIDNKYYFIVQHETTRTYSIYDEKAKSFKLRGCSSILIVRTSPVIFYAEKNNMTYLFDAEGSQISAFKANHVIGLTNSPKLFIFKRDDLWGLANIRGEVIQNPKWEMVKDNCGLAYVGIYEKGTKRDFILRNGKIAQEDPCNSGVTVEMPVAK